MTFDNIYRDAILHVKSHGHLEHNKRTGSDIMATNGYSFRWDMNYLPMLLARKTYVKTGAAEVAWMLSGEKSITWLQRYTKIWDAFADKDGVIDTAYGARWKYAFGVDQIANIIEKLREDPSSRQQVLLSWDPGVDNVVPAPNIPCPYTAVFNIIDGKLNCHLTLRSNDVYLGLPYDVLMYTLLSKLLANSVGVAVGEMFYSIAHMHIYENQFAACDEIIARKHPGSLFGFNINLTVEDVLEDRDSFVELCVNQRSLQLYKPEVGPKKVEVVK